MNIALEPVGSDTEDRTSSPEKVEKYKDLVLLAFTYEKEEQEFFVLSREHAYETARKITTGWSSAPDTRQVFTIEDETDTFKGSVIIDTRLRTIRVMDIPPDKG